MNLRVFYLTRRGISDGYKQRAISTAAPPHPKNKAGTAKFQILSLSANLGAETNESGGGDE